MLVRFNAALLVALSLLSVSPAYGDEDDYNRGKAWVEDLFGAPSTPDQFDQDEQIANQACASIGVDQLGELATFDDACLIVLDAQFSSYRKTAKTVHQAIQTEIDLRIAAGVFNNGS